jgi:hypothetical protein
MFYFVNPVQVLVRGRLTVAFMSARYRIKEHKHTFTPQRRVLGMWISIARPQPTMQAASELIRGKLKGSHPHSQSHPQPPTGR